ncbi:hypothetical protein BJ165DRAFT_1445854 [Panaeolus papilionaceus]|nr:hypothetical protein BJ165DRAFT_1445854 [Panaeolus papilionaceus]
MSDTTSMIIVDDTSPLIHYNGDWSLDSTTAQDAKGNFGSVYNTTQHWTKGNNSFTFSFEGSYVVVIGSNNPQSSWQCSIDGVTFASSPFQFWENNWWMCSTSIHDGPHTLTVNAIVADGEMFWFDRVIYTPSVSVSLSNQAMFIDNHNTQIQYGAGWRIDGGSANITNQAGTKFTYEFDGTSIRWFGYVGGGTPTASATYSIDGGTPTTFIIATQVPGGTSLFNQQYFQTPDLSPGRHVLNVEYLGGAPNAAGLILDYLEVRGATVSGGNMGTTSPNSNPVNGTTSTPSLSGTATAAQASKSSHAGVTQFTTITGSSSVIPSNAAQSSGSADTSFGSGSTINGTGQAGTKSKLNAGTIVGGTLGGLAFLLVFIFGLVCLRARQRWKRAAAIAPDDPPAYGEYSDTTVSTPSTPHGIQIPPSKLRSSNS